MLEFGNRRWSSLRRESVGIVIAVGFREAQPPDRSPLSDKHQLHQRRYTGRLQQHNRVSFR
jgi:hypothetical protein